MSHQSRFRKFDEAIKLRRLKEHKELNEKSSVILEHIRKKIAVPHTFQPFPQGSYAVGTGIKPPKGDYDIDLGIVFNVCWEDHTPVTVKGWVHEALKDFKPEVKWRRPCITVYYQRGGEPRYHVDLAILAKDRYGSGLRLALGKQNAAPPDQAWQPDDRLGFMQAVESRFSGTDGEQFCRVIRYLKRWKAVHFPADGPWAPTGFALTVAAYSWFQPTKSGNEYDDLRATEALLRAIQQRFVPTWDPGTGSSIPLISLHFPFAPQDDLFGRMSKEQMKQFHQRLEKLIGWLDEARRTNSPASLRTAFGTDFPDQ